MLVAATRTISRAALPALPVTILVLTFALPPETSVSIGSLRLSPYRITLILMLLPSINRLLANREVPPSILDLMMAMHGIWAALSLVITMGVAEGGETAGIYVIETFGAYLVARAYVTNFEEFVNVLKLGFLVTVSLLLFAAAESFSGVHLLREPFKAVLGGAGPHEIEPRLGLTRAFASFEHPILFGVFSAAGFAGTYYVLCDAKLGKETYKRLGAIAAATFFSLSGGPYTALAFQGGLIAWDRITAGIAGRWNILLGVFVSIWLVLTLASNRSPLLVFISYLTFSASSAYNRVHIWNYGTAEVARHPLFGIGLNDWIRAPWMSSSMDNFWLLTTMRYGIPATVFLLAAVVILLVRFHGRFAPGSRQITNARKGWTITFMGFLLAGLTVHFWNSLMVQFFFFIGCGVALLNTRSNIPQFPQKVTLKMPMQPKRRQPSWT